MSAYSGFTVEETTDRVSHELRLQSELTYQPLSTSLESDTFVQIQGWSFLTFHLQTQLFLTYRSRQLRDLMVKYKLLRDLIM